MKWPIVFSVPVPPLIHRQRAYTKGSSHPTKAYQRWKKAIALRIKCLIGKEKIQVPITDYLVADLTVHISQKKAGSDICSYAYTVLKELARLGFLFNRFLVREVRITVVTRTDKDMTRVMLVLDKLHAVDANHAKKIPYHYCGYSAQLQQSKSQKQKLGDEGPPHEGGSRAGDRGDSGSLRTTHQSGSAEEGLPLDEGSGQGQVVSPHNEAEGCSEHHQQPQSDH